MLQANNQRRSIRTDNRIENLINIPEPDFIRNREWIDFTLKKHSLTFLS